jgi:hypothetical protein
MHRGADHNDYGHLNGHRPSYLIVNRERELGLDRRETG